MNTGQPVGLIVNFSQLSDILAIVLSLVALVVTIVGFFASLKFYRDGVTLQRLANDALSKIEEKASSIQSQVGGMFEKTLDAAIARKNELSMNFDAINEQIKDTNRVIVDAALKEIGTADTTERDKLKTVVDAQLTEVKKLVETTRERAQDAVWNAWNIHSLSPSASPPSSLYKIKILELLRGVNDWMSVSDIAKSVHLSIAETIFTLQYLVHSGEIEFTTKETTPFYRRKVPQPPTT